MLKIGVSAFGGWVLVRVALVSVPVLFMGKPCEIGGAGIEPTRSELLPGFDIRRY